MLVHSSSTSVVVTGVEVSTLRRKCRGTPELAPLNGGRNEKRPRERWPCIRWLPGEC